MTWTSSLPIFEWQCSLVFCSNARAVFEVVARQCWLCGVLALLETHFALLRRANKAAAVCSLAAREALSVLASIHGTLVAGVVLGVFAGVSRVFFGIFC